MTRNSIFTAGDVEGAGFYAGNRLPARALVSLTKLTMAVKKLFLSFTRSDILRLQLPFGLATSKALDTHLSPVRPG